MLPNSYIDAHCHLADPRLSSSLEVSLEAAKRVGISSWVQGGIDPNDWQRQLALREKFGSSIILCFGLHPWWVAGSSESQRDEAMVELSKQLPKADAIGELGLDFLPKHGSVESRHQQVILFEKQLRLANQYYKPMVLHVVQAHAEALDVLRRQGPFPRGGIVHAFTGSFEVAREYLELGLVISVGGAVTRPGYRAVKAAIPLLPPEGIVIETDAPDQKPFGDVGAFNEPSNLVPIAAAVAKLRSESTEAVLGRSSRVLRKLFGVST